MGGLHADQRRHGRQDRTCRNKDVEGHERSGEGKHEYDRTGPIRIDPDDLQRVGGKDRDHVGGLAKWMTVCRVMSDLLSVI
jgi:hypothetical protein